MVENLVKEKRGREQGERASDSPAIATSDATSSVVRAALRSEEEEAAGAIAAGGGVQRLPSKEIYSSKGKPKGDWNWRVSEACWRRWVMEPCAADNLAADPVRRRNMISS